MPDPTKLIGKAPETDDPIVWIAILLSVVVVGLLVWQLRAANVERKESEARQDASLASFRTEMAAQRLHDAAQVEGTHKRIDGLSEEIRDLSKVVQSRPHP